jgi:hypothetical protein
LISLASFTQTFNKRLNWTNSIYADGRNCFEVNEGYVFFASYLDTLKLVKSGCIFTDAEGEITLEKSVFDDSTSLYIGYYGGVDQFDSGFVSCGNYYTPPYDVVQSATLMYNLSGDTIWTRIYQSPTEDIYLYAALKVEDGVLACGQSNTDTTPGAGLLLKYDNDGNLLWRKDYLPTTTTDLILVSAVEIPTGGFLLGGASLAPFNWNHMIIKTDNEGNQIWRKFQGDEFNNYYAMVGNTADGKYIFGGQDKNAEQFEDASQVTKMNTNGTYAWTQTYGEYGPDCAVFAIKQMPDGGFILCGGDRSSWSLYGYICRIDADGNQLWYRKYQQTEGNWGYLSDVVHTSDNGFLLTGFLESEGELSQDVWALKLDSLGCLVPGCAVGIIEDGQQAAMRIYPNPADAFINVFVESKNVKDCELHLYDMQGKQIYCTTIRESGNTFMMDSSSLPAGIYLLHLQLDGVVVKSEKVVVRHGE